MQLAQGRAPRLRAELELLTLLGAARDLLERFRGGGEGGLCVCVCQCFLGGGWGPKDDDIVAGWRGWKRGCMGVQVCASPRSELADRLFRPSSNRHCSNNFLWLSFTEDNLLTYSAASFFALFQQLLYGFIARPSKTPPRDAFPAIDMDFLLSLWEGCALHVG